MQKAKSANLKRALLGTAIAISAILGSGAAVSASVHLTPGSASAAFKAKISEQFPTASFPPAEGQLCPEVFEYEDGPVSSCFAEYTTGGTWHFQGGSAEVQRGTITFSYPSHTTWHRTWHRCKLHRVPGKLFSNDNCGFGRPETDAYFVEAELSYNIQVHKPLRSIGWQFTNSIGFNSLGRYTGKRRGRSLIFTNAVGDAFRYRP